MCRLPFRFGDWASERSASGRSASDRIVRIGTWQQFCESGEAEAVRPLGGAARRLARCAGSFGRFRVTSVDDGPGSRTRAGAGEGSKALGPCSRSFGRLRLTGGLDGDVADSERDKPSHFVVNVTKDLDRPLAANFRLIGHVKKTELTCFGLFAISDRFQLPEETLDRDELDVGLRGRTNRLAGGDPDRCRSTANDGLDGLFSPDGGSGCRFGIGSGAMDGSLCDTALDGRRDLATDGRSIASGRLLFRAVATDDGVASCALHTSGHGRSGIRRLSLKNRHGVARN